MCMTARIVSLCNCITERVRGTTTETLSTYRTSRKSSKQANFVSYAIQIPEKHEASFAVGQRPLGSCCLLVLLEHVGLDVVE